MRDYFRPFRRKLGIVMLALACAIASAWVRSNRVTDHSRVQIPSSGSLTMHSHHGRFYWSSHFTIGSPCDWERRWETSRLGVFAEVHPWMWTIGRHDFVKDSEVVAPRTIVWCVTVDLEASTG